MKTAMKFLAAAWFAVGMAIGHADAADLRVGAAAVELEADDSMPIAGGIHPGYVKGQEGKLRATAFVVEKPRSATVAIVSCDVLMFQRDLADAAIAEIERTCGIPAANVMVHATHTHHAPSTIRIHGYGHSEVFCRRLQAGIVKAVRDAKAATADTTFCFKLGTEPTVGMNSRLLMKDGTIHWVGPRDDAVGPTGPFDPDLPVLAFRSPAGKLQALVFGHSSHSIGTLKPGVRSPSFYGMAAQELEKGLGCTAVFLEGASGSTHVYNMGPKQAFDRIKKAVLETLAQAEPQEIRRLSALKRPFVFKVRHFDEAAEEKAVSDYCKKRIGSSAESVIEVFRKMRKELAPQQGQERTTWIQTIAIGDVAIVGVPAEFFTKLGLDIKRHSPFKHTVIVELANDWIGYVGDREAYKLGGYQLWTGFHSYSEAGTGERMVDQAVAMLEELAKGE